MDMELVQKDKKTDNRITVQIGPGVKKLKVLDHKVFDNPLAQVITWNLDPGLRRGDFISFTWSDPPPPAGIFGNPEISPDGNSLTLRNLNNDPAKSRGSFGYIITIELDDETYTSEETTSTNGVMRDPIIINR